MRIYKRSEDKNYLPLRLLIYYENKYFHIAELSFNRKSEFFYTPITNKHKKIYYDDFNYNKLDIDRIGHFSFHQDGKIHIKYKKGRKNKYNIIEDLPNNIFYNFNPDNFAILMVDSVILSSRNKSGLKEIKNINDIRYKNHPIWEIEKIKVITFIIFLVHDSKAELSLLNIDWIKSCVCYYPKLEPILIKGYNDFNIFILVSDKIIKSKNSNDLDETNYRFFYIPGTDPIEVIKF